MRETIDLEFEGKTYRVWYSVEKGMINVGCDFDSKWASLGALPPEVLARMIGLELLTDAKRKGQLY